MKRFALSAALLIPALPAFAVDAQGPRRGAPAVHRAIPAPGYRRSLWTALSAAHAANPQTAVSPKIEALLERAREIRPEAFAPACAGRLCAQDGPAEGGLSTLAAAERALNALDVSQIRSLSAEEVEGVARRLFEGAARDGASKAPEVGKAARRISIPPGRPPKQVKAALTSYDIYRARYGDDEAVGLLKKAQGLDEHLNKVLFGQREAVKFFKSKLINYLQTYKTRTKAPVYAVFAGLPGIGKSDLAAQAAEYMGLPSASISLQGYAGDDEKVPEAFAHALNKALNGFKGKPGILILDELDKVFEINEHGEEVDRPVMGMINALLNDGSLSYQGEWRDYDADFSKVMVVVTSNFRPQVYGELQAHPDLTSIGDLLDVHEQVGKKPVDIAEALGTMFRQNTVSRLLPGTFVMSPLDEKAYRDLIDLQIGLALKRLISEPKAMRLTVTDGFKKFLFQEAVVPATGARETVEGVGHIVESAFGEALTRLPEDFAYRPLKLVLDYDASRGVVVISGKAQPAKGFGGAARGGFTAEYAPILRYGVVPIAEGEKIPEERLDTSAHETGHALAHLRYGVPLELVRVEPPSRSIGGFTKGGDAAFKGREIYARLLVQMGSRAMERIIYSPDPRDRAQSYVAITRGSASDLEEASRLALRLVSEYGLDATFSPISRWRKLPKTQDEMTRPIPEEMYQRAATLLERIENFLVEDFLYSHDRAWHLQKIKRVARAGRLTGEEFEKIMGKTSPADAKANLDKAIRAVLSGDAKSGT